jgi:hypothetical protein
MFSLVFRAVLILHADKGLVQKGRLNLRLFNQLYWVAVCTFVMVGHTMLLARLVKGIFPSSIKVGKICLLLDISGGDSHLKVDLIQLAFVTIDLFFIKYINWRIDRFLSGFCPGNKMSCIGVYKINVICFKDTTKMLHVLILVGIFLIISRTIFEHLDKTLSPITIFWIWSIYGIMFDMFVFFLPFSFELPDDTIYEKHTSTFYVRKLPPVLEPRRPIYKPNIGQEYSPHKADKESTVHEPNQVHNEPNCLIYCKVHGKARIPDTQPSLPISISLPKMIQVKEWTDNSRCNGKGKGKGKGKCKGKCPAKKASLQT